LPEDRLGAPLSSARLIRSWSMRLWVSLILAVCLLPAAEDNIPLGERTRQYLVDLLRIDTSNPPGHETRVAEYLKQVADMHSIPNELLGADPKRLNFVARLKGSGKGRPLLLMAHSDVVPVDRTQWTVDPFKAELHNGFIYGRGAMDDKNLLAAELAVMVEIKRRNIRLNRDVILLAEADEESGSSGIQWLTQQAWPKIEAEFALNEGGSIREMQDGGRVFQTQTAEKIPTRVVLTAHGTAGHASLPRPDNPVVRLAHAITRLVDADQPVRLNSTTRRYFRELSKLPDYSWLQPILPRLENPATATAAANQIRSRDPELDAMLRTSVSPTMLRAGMKINVIPNSAEAMVDVRRLPNETREEVLTRFRQIINDPEIDVSLALGQQTPPTEPSSLTTPLYKAIEKVATTHPEDFIMPYMSRGATDGAFLRAKGMAVYGAPLFVREGGDSRAHGNDERISPKNLEDGSELLWQMVLEVAGQ
jgi:acetylornithine deacetylase/succinyl-diaminopimelate desuccinylase-like protein